LKIKTIASKLLKPHAYSIIDGKWKTMAESQISTIKHHGAAILHKLLMVVVKNPPPQFPMAPPWPIFDNTACLYIYMYQALSNDLFKWNNYVVHHGNAK
jgi:hypothetical protein